MRELHPGNDADFHEGLGLTRELHERGDQVVEIRCIRVIGNPDGAVAGMLGAANQLRGPDLSVAEKRMRVKVDHLRPPEGLARILM